MYERIFDLGPGIVISCAVIAIAHLLLWERKLPRLPSYVAGTLSVLSGMVVSAWQLGDAWVIVFYLLHLIPAAFVVFFAWAVRGRIAASAVATEDAHDIEEAARRERTARPS